MTTARSIKINFQHDSRDVDLPYPATLTGLQAAVASTFEVELPVRASNTAADGDLSFTYLDPDGDDIMFDRDSELSLALRLCPESLEISAAPVAVEPEEPRKPTVKIARLYHVAARNLREYNGVPSMTPAMVIKTLALFKLPPRRLVQQRLAPAKLLKELKNASNVAGASAGGSGDTSEHKEHYMPNGGEYERDWENGFGDFARDRNPGVFDVETATSSGEEQAPTSEEDTHSSSSSSDENINSTAKKSLVGVKGVIHAALAAADIQLKPREAKPLFRALDVHPVRLVRLGLVDGKDLRAAHKHRARGGLEKPTDFVPGPNDDWGKGGKPYGPIPIPSNAGDVPHGVFQYTPPPHWACTATPFAPPGTWCLIQPGGPPAAPDTYANWGGMMPPWVESGVHQREAPPSHHRGSVSDRHHGWFF